MMHNKIFVGIIASILLFAGITNLANANNSTEELTHILIDGQWIRIGTDQATDYLISIGMFGEPRLIKQFNNSPIIVIGRDG